MAQQPPDSPDYFEAFEPIDPALYTSPLPSEQPLLPPSSPNLFQSSISPGNQSHSNTGQDLQFVFHPSTHGLVPAQPPIPADGGSTSNLATLNFPPLRFVDSQTAAPKGRPPNPKLPQASLQLGSDQPRKVGRPLDSRIHRPYDGPRGLIDTPSSVPRIAVSLSTTSGQRGQQRSLAEYGIGPNISAEHASPVLATARDTASSSGLVSSPDSSPSLAAPRIEHVIPDMDPDQIIDLDDTDLSDPSTYMGQGQGNEDSDSDAEDDSETQTGGKRKPIPAFLQDVCTKFKAKAEKHYKEHETFWVPQKSNIFHLGGNLRNKSAARAKPTAEAMYNPRLFYWDPMYFLDIVCPSPACGANLTYHGYTRPRRVVDMHDCFYMIGRRYHCPKCKSKTGKSTITFNSWDSRIMKTLPPQLLDEFPAYLSHRGAMAKSVFEMMRTAFHYGLGSKQFSNSLQVLHRLQFDKLHAQYLDGVLAWAKAYPEQMLPDNPLLFTEFSSFDDPKGYAGFVPSSTWLRVMYDKYIEEHGTAMDQQAAMKSLRLGAIDHTYKTTKQIMKINGESVFAATLTLTNEFGEARVLAFVATSSHVEFESALQKVRENLDRYGLSQPEAIFTDNPAADKLFLEGIFPSLTRDVVAPDKYPGMETFDLPAEVDVRVFSDAANIQNELAKITTDLNDNDPEDRLVVGFDAEWNVDTTSRTKQPTAIIQIAYKNWVDIFQIAHFKGKLPAALISFLKTDQIVKAGRAVKQDLSRLEQETGSGPFHGGVDLARMAKDARVITDARMGLADLCARILRKTLTKEAAGSGRGRETVRVSSSWSNAELSSEQIRYAALDALASLYIYNRLAKAEVPGKISDSDLPGTFVSVHHTDGQLIAHGQISVLTVPLPGAPQVTKTRVRVTVSEVCVPAAIVPLHNRQALEMFGPVPFDIIYARNKVFRRTSGPSENLLATGSNVDLANQEPDTRTAAELKEVQDFLAQESSEAAEEAANWMQEIDSPPQEADTVNAPAEPDPHLLDINYDQAAMALFNDPEFSTWSLETRSRILMDIWHGMSRVKTPKEHGMRRSFGIALRDAVLIPNEEDKARIVAYLKSQNLTWDHQIRFNARWLWHRCRRTVPPPDKLYEAVNEVFKLYGPQKDSKTNLPLFNAQAWHDAKNVLKAIRLGLLSDPPGVQLYYQMCIERKTRLPIYRCARGTNNPEGSIHKSLRDRMPKSGTSIRHAAARIKDYVFIHNLVVGTVNRSGKMYQGHYNVELLNRLQISLESSRDLVPNAPLLRGWINGSLYVPGGENVGILVLPEKTRLVAGILPHNTMIDSGFKHAYLAQQQGTKYAVITVHSVEEKMHFTAMMQASTGPLNFKEAARTWNSEANGETIFYKLGSHLESYHARWLRSVNEKNTVSQILPAAKSLERRLRSDMRATEAYTAAAIPLPVQQPMLSGLLPREPNPDPIVLPEVHAPAYTTFRPYHPPAMESNTDSHSAQDFTDLLSWPTDPEYENLPPLSECLLGYDDGLSDNNFSNPEFGNWSEAPIVPDMALTASSSSAPLVSLPPGEKSKSKRSRDTPSEIFISADSHKKRRRICLKCGQDGCKGGYRKKLCTSPCRDCKQIDCEGRNAAHPEVACAGGIWSVS